MSPDRTIADSCPSPSLLSFHAQKPAPENHNSSQSECLCQHCSCFSPSSADVCACSENVGGPETFHGWFLGRCVDGTADSLHECVMCVLVFGQSHTAGGDAESTCEGWWYWLLWTMPLCPSCPDPLPSLFSGRPGVRSVLSAQFSPWEISDVKRSTRLPFNP